VKVILQLPGAERRRCHVFQSNARLINAMQIVQEYERVLVQHRTSATANSKIRLFAGRLMNTIHRKIDYKLCTQTDILRFLFSHIKDLKEDSLQQTTVGELQKFQPVISIPMNETAIDGYLKMLDTGTNACAVVDRDNRIVATLSASDLRGMTNGYLKALLLPVMEFFQVMTGLQPSPPLTCTLDESLLLVMQRIMRASTRRCWVVDEYYRPIGLLSMGIIIRTVLTNPCEHL